MNTNKRFTTFAVAIAIALIALLAFSQTTFAAGAKPAHTAEIAQQQEGTTPCDGLDLESTPAELLACITYQAGLLDKYLDEKINGGEDNAYQQDSAANLCPDPDHHMNLGEVYMAHANCITKGDVEVGASADGPWHKLYDSESGTGVVLVCEQDCYIKAPSGGNVSNRTMPDLVNEMLNTGCDDLVNGCKIVYVYYWPGGKSENRTELFAMTTPTATSAMTPTVTITVPAMTQTPTAPAPTKTPRPVVTVPATTCDNSIPKNRWMYVPADCIISGDIAVSDSLGGTLTPLYDSRWETGLVVVLHANTWVYSPFGATATSALLDDVVEAQDLVGCGMELSDGCEIVVVKHWPAQ